MSPWVLCSYFSLSLEAYLGLNTENVWLKAR